MIEIPVPLEIRLALEAEGSTDIHCYVQGPVTVIVSRDPTHHGILKHLSISRPDHYPSWNEIRNVRDAYFMPDTDVAMILPRAGDYVSVHPNCFHLWEIPVEWGIR